MKRLKKWWLKLLLKRTYISIAKKFNDYNCGHKLLLTVSSEYFNLCDRYNSLADKLRLIDDAVPEFRYDLNP